jgi:hypothetical protein
LLHEPPRNLRYLADFDHYMTKETAPARGWRTEAVLFLDAIGRLWHPPLSGSNIARLSCSFLTTCPKFFAFSTIYWESQRAA